MCPRTNFIKPEHKVRHKFNEVVVNIRSTVRTFRSSTVPNKKYHNFETKFVPVSDRLLYISRSKYTFVSFGL